MIYLWSQFQPDTASDWWNFGINVITAFGTLAAVGFAVHGTNRSRADAADARKETATAREEEKAAQERALRLQEEANRFQVLQAARASIAEDARDRDRAKAEATANAARWAREQAQFVRLRAAWTTEHLGTPHARYEWSVTNSSGATITDIDIFLAPPMVPQDDNGSGEFRTRRIVDRIAELGVRSSSRGEHLALWSGIRDGWSWSHRRPSVVAYFTDNVGNRWFIDEDDSLMLSGTRALGVDPTPLRVDWENAFYATGHLADLGVDELPEWMSRTDGPWDPVTSTWLPRPGQDKGALG